MSSTVYLSDRIATLTGPVDGLGLIDRGAIVVEDGVIAWVGPQDELPEFHRSETTLHFGGRLITPGLIDCHTHLVFGGNRANEFERRLRGETYEEISRSGGGIMATVRATRDASIDTLVEGAKRRLESLIADGVTAVEIKSGYGLDRVTELNMLRAARKLGEAYPITVRTSFLGAHAIPSEFKGDSDTYLESVCIPTLKEAHAERLVDAVDGFCESIAFSPIQIAKVFDTAVGLGLPVKLHAEQLSNLGGVQVAARYNALSADHLEHANENDASALAESGSVAVLLPGAFYTLKETEKPPIASFRRHSVPMAVATDSNPGSSPLSSLLLAMNMACTLFGLTPAEALAGVTKHAAKALGLGDRGQIAPSMRADLAVWDVREPAELSYTIGLPLLHRRLCAEVA